MSIVGHGRSSLNCVCRCSSGLSSACRPAIHMLRRRECVHPRDHADARVIRVRFQTHGPNALRRFDDWFAHDACRHCRGRIQALGDVRCVLGNLLQRRLAIELLAAGDEPDFHAGQRLHGTLRAPLRESLLAPTGARGSAEANTRYDCTQPIAGSDKSAEGVRRRAGRAPSSHVERRARRTRRQRQPARNEPSRGSADRPVGQQPARLRVANRLAESAGSTGWSVPCGAPARLETTCDQWTGCQRAQRVLVARSNGARRPAPRPRQPPRTRRRWRVAARPTAGRRCAEGNGCFAAVRKRIGGDDALDAQAAQHSDQ